MAYAVATSMISVPVPGAWVRLSLINGDGPLSGLGEQQLVAKLEEMGIPRHHYGLVRVLQSWRRAAVPPDIAFALWLLRDCLPSEGGMPRRAGSAAEDTGPTIRYMQLALEAGETASTDPNLPILAKWLVERQLPDGSIPANLGTDQGEAGSTARALRVLWRLNDPSLHSHIDRMHRYLLNSAQRGAFGAAWAYSPIERTLVTGATSLAVLALLERDPKEPVILDALQFLIAAQNTSGGWSEVPGYTPTIHNTFNVVRAIRAGQAAGLISGEGDRALAAARNWFRYALMRRRSSRTILDKAYALRLAAALNLLDEKRVEKLAVGIACQRNRFLSLDADLYAEAEITAIALLECSRQLDAASGQNRDWSWRWQLPGLPPPFLCRAPYLYELLYGMFRSCWWVKLVDYVVQADVVDRAAGLFLGVVAALGVDGNLTAVFQTMSNGPHGIAAVTLVAVFLIAWLVVKASALSFLRAGRRAFSSLVAAVALTWLLLTPTAVFPSLIALTGLRWLVIDVISHTADSMDFFNRLARK